MGAWYLPGETKAAKAGVAFPMSSALVAWKYEGTSE